MPANVARYAEIERDGNLTQRKINKNLLIVTPVGIEQTLSRHKLNLILFTIQKEIS